MSTESSVELKLQDHLAPVLELLQKQQIVESLTQRQEQVDNNALVENLVHRQHEVALRRKLTQLQAADLAHLLEMLPMDQRTLVWQLVDEKRAARTLAELNDAALSSLIRVTPQERLMQILPLIDLDDLPELADFIPDDLLAAVKTGLEAQERQWLEQTLQYPEDRVGNLMSREALQISGAATVDEAIKYVQQCQSIPEQTDKLFIVEGKRTLTGVVPLSALLRHEGRQKLSEIMDTDVVRFQPEEEAESAAYAFERYDLISAPVVDDRNRILGRLTVETMMDYLRESQESLALANQGLSARADLFAPVWHNARNRWFWLGLNLVTAFIATRFIALFESTIENLVALATLMPIVASIGGNTGHQTATLMIRSLSLDQIQRSNLPVAFAKELGVSLINGIIWGTVMGCLAALFYQNIQLGLVMLVAVLLNLVLAAIFGLLTPLTVDRLGKDPAMGTSVILTFVTDSMGFFLFLGLATLWL